MSNIEDIDFDRSKKRINYSNQQFERKPTR
jgi:hypothetical protein